MTLAAALLLLCSAVDADTLSCPTYARHIRVARIDAPESFHPQCQAERELAARAKAFTREFLAEPVEIIVTGYDRRWDRYIAHVRRDGVDLGEALVRRGLARWWDGARRSWCDGGK